MEQQLTTLEKELVGLNLELKVFMQKYEDKHEALNDKLELILTRVKVLDVGEHENNMFQERITTIWKGVGLLTTILVVVIGAVYVLGKDIGILHH